VYTTLETFPDNELRKLIMWRAPNFHSHWCCFIPKSQIEPPDHSLSRDEGFLVLSARLDQETDKSGAIGCLIGIWPIKTLEIVSS
jgi:hypothetical protein